MPIAFDVEPLTNALVVPDGSLTARELDGAKVPLHRLVLWTRKECLVELGRCALERRSNRMKIWRGYAETRFSTGTFSAGTVGGRV